MKKIISLILSFILFFPSYLFSFLPQNIDTDFDFESGVSDGKIMVNDPNGSNYKKDKSNKRTIERDGIKKSPFCICKMEIFYSD